MFEVTHETVSIQDGMHVSCIGIKTLMVWLSQIVFTTIFVDARVRQLETIFRATS